MFNKFSQTQVFLTLFGLTAVLFVGLTLAVIQFALPTTNVEFAVLETQASAEWSFEPDFGKLPLVFEANY